MKQIIKPQRLAAGSTVGLVAPAGFMEPERIDRIICNLEKRGYKIKAGEFLYNKRGYLAGADCDRAEDINSMFENKNISAVVCIRGGYGTPRILEQVDYECIEKNPKILIGYSDITALLLSVHKKTGLLTFHGPMAASEMFEGKDDYSLMYFKALLEYGASSIDILNPYGHCLSILSEGSASGRLTGGNLSLICSTLGTPFEIDARGKLLFLEDVGEEPYRVDRMLAQLKLAGKLRDAEGVILCSFSGCEAEDKTKSLELREVFEDYFAGCGKPVIQGYMIGHCTPNISVAIGAKAYINTCRLIFSINEACVV
ncbi:MAG: S66 peptidase family protein [Bacillota bacterium]